MPGLKDIPSYKNVIVSEHFNAVLVVYRFRSNRNKVVGPRQANLVLIVYASSEGLGEPAHPRSLARTFAARSYKQ